MICVANDTSCQNERLVMDFQNIIDNPVFRGLLGYLGAFLIAKNPNLIRKAVPVVLLVANLVVELVRVLFPALVPDAHAADAVRVVSATRWFDHLLVVIGSTAVSVGLHSGPKNTIEWIQAGLGLFRKPRR